MIVWILSAALGILLVMIVYQLIFFLSRRMAKGKQPPMEHPPEMWRSSAFVSPIIIVFSLTFITIFSWGSIELWGFVIPDVGALILWIIVGLVMAILGNILGAYFTGSGGFHTPVASDSIPHFTILVIGLASISEELLFRGFLQQLIDINYLLAWDLGDAVITSGAIVAAILFGIVHAMPAKMMGKNPLPLVISSMILGLTAGIGLSSSESLLVPILIHMLFNAIGLLMSLRSPNEERFP